MNIDISKFYPIFTGAYSQLYVKRITEVLNYHFYAETSPDSFNVLSLCKELVSK